ncbi:MAG TPA: hypothetical protein VMR33_07970 [Candidatus Baltobacteraceae bacterium]|jgi:hypothetical protein|nr:hypothetical protein [Candidatus Baltobacteraceae bacterium]
MPGVVGRQLFQSVVPGYAWTERGRDGESAVSVVRFKTPDQAALDETAADLSILSFIFSQNLERALSEDGDEMGAYKLGIPMLLQTGGQSVEASYIEGFGAVFDMKVRFPLVRPADADKESQTSPANSEWEQARRALAGDTQSDPRSANPFEKTVHFNPKLVETLKKRVIQLLGNASHLRHVQPDEWVAVTFSGPPNVVTPNSGVGSASAGGGSLGSSSIDDPNEPAKPSSSSSKPDEASPGTENPSQPGQNIAAARRVPNRMTILTIRVKKTNADAFAANKMTEDEFFRSAEIANYLGPIVENGSASDSYSVFGRWSR